MKEFPKVNIDSNDLYKMLIAPIKSQLLLTGIELKVFNQLSKPKLAGTIAEAIDAHPENTRIFLDGLTTSGLVVKKKGLYKNTPVTETFLVEGKPTFLGDFLVYIYRWSVPALKNMTEMVKKGPPALPEMDSTAEDIWAQAAMVMANSQRTVSGPLAVRIISSLPEFPLFKKMLDLGGGPGLIGIAITAAHADMKGIIFDRPSVVKVAEAFIREYEMENRMKVMGGDYACDQIGEGYDLIWASSTLNFYRDNMDVIIKKIYNALNPGGVFSSVSDGLTHERTGPDIMALSWVPMALMGQDMGLDQGFIVDSMLRVGFKSVRSRTIDTPMGPMDLDIGRK